MGPLAAWIRILNLPLQGLLLLLQVVVPLPDHALIVQLRGHGECWGAGYDQPGVKKSTGTAFVANSSP